MARKKRGYVELYWTCPNCNGENLGSVTTCAACGSPQPDDIEFHQASKQELVQDEGKLKRAKAGADIHCGFCGTRNPGDAVKCSQCGADLTEGEARASAGRVVGAFKAGAPDPIKCPSCGTMNDGKRLKCAKCGTGLPRASKAKPAAPTGSSVKANPRLLAIGGIILLGLCGALWFLFLRTTPVEAQVTGALWERAVVIEAFGDFEFEGWRSDIPSGADINSCSEEYRYTQSEQPSGGRYEEVCGTPYNEETGSGFAEVVQDCEYRVYEDYCSYTSEDWAPIATEVLTGVNLSPRWPSPNLSSNERLGEEIESYTCFFQGEDGERYTFETDSANEFSLCRDGATLTLNVNGAGAVVSIEP
mgnify:FL=1